MKYYKTENGIAQANEALAKLNDFIEITDPDEIKAAAEELKKAQEAIKEAKPLDSIHQRIAKLEAAVFKDTKE